MQRSAELSLQEIEKIRFALSLTQIILEIRQDGGRIEQPVLDRVWRMAEDKTGIVMRRYD